MNESRAVQKLQSVIEYREKKSMFVYIEENASSRSLGKEESVGIQTYRVKV